MRLDTPEGRKGWAFVAMVGGAMVFTVFAGFAVWTLRHEAGLSFWLGLAAHGQIFAVLASLGGLLVRRVIELRRSGAKYEDKGEQE